mmetsp:Transcript_53334/g.152905  ORF Transcript_53334/g.152905 Transcript_53334/m.152905 type:complete len:366 (+) Transcript_53334:87-1184(+)|eukprot:CAMPEP_0177325046 /NCGR_PEP_ID=MMETSP0368-20130122/17593_1 /TAXON_ID=447022 ORGANISM="Scrippsiella hangoei-like, Strain SHHI-4" /NCGR_SAMPLE_ID=MMETSP0368 /ASSEMBLY_ACC=CAM_ASM_000363 /LENGTH=365 /DNA_ID=CAMNT_0018784905 /DNA_START=51 /DNA_END=1148 /DNA_ORIENTATION=+
MYMFLAIVLLCGVELGLCWNQQVDSASVEAHSLDVDDDCSADSSCGANLLQHRAKKYERQDEKKALVPALVDEVYTYGAPATHMPSFRSSATEDGCFPGLRSYTEDQHGPNGFQHQVDAGAMFTKYPHMSISSVCLHWETDSIYTPCTHTNNGDAASPSSTINGGLVYQNWGLHQENDYTDRLRDITLNGTKVGAQNPFDAARKFAFAAWRSYTSLDEQRGEVAFGMSGWNLVGRANFDGSAGDTDAVSLIQERDTLDCAVIFEGTNSLSEMFTTIVEYGTGYCGFDNVHVGIRNELWSLTGGPWETDIKPKLEACNRVLCIGHSLGGALCEVFAACANSGHYSDPDYQRLAWGKKMAAQMKEVL